MNATSQPNGTDQLASISGLVHEFFERRRAGEELTPAQFVAEHPEANEHLQPYLAEMALAGEFCTPGSTTTLSRWASRPTTVLPEIPGFEVIEEIGRGGMGVVYRALQISTKRVVALKVVLAGPFAGPEVQRRFEREIELAARLQHPNIVRVLESGEALGRRYYSMDYIAGARLSEHLAKVKPELRRLLALFIELCRAVEYAHDHGVVHRDLKPGNVLVDDDGTPHILDFGLAKALHEVTADEAGVSRMSITGQVLGTLAYLSPEQAAGLPGEIDGRSDVYALGVILYEALAGALPYAATGPMPEVLQRILEAPPAPLSSNSRWVHAELETIVLKALEKERDRRYQSAREFGEDLQRYLDGEPIRAHRPSRLYVLRKKMRKHRTGVILGVVSGFIVVAGLLSASWWRERDFQRFRRDCLDCLWLADTGELETANLKIGLLRRKHAPCAEARVIEAQVKHRIPKLQGSAIRSLADRQHPEWACDALLADIYEKEGNSAEADRLRVQVEHAMPDTADAWYLRSLATLDPIRAQEFAQSALSHDPEHRLALIRVTRLQYSTGALIEALGGAEQLLEVDADREAWTLLKGWTLTKLGRYRDAASVFAGFDTLKIHCACAYRRLGEYEAAYTAYTEHLNPNRYPDPDPWCLYQRATVLWILGRTDDALQDLRDFQRLHRGSSFADARAFLILRETGQHEAAQATLDAALRNVEKPSWLNRIFLSLAGRLTPDELVAEARASSDRERICEACYYAGELCLLAGQRAQARAWFEQCVQTEVVFDPNTLPLTPMNEYELAEWRLRTPFPTTAPSSHP